MTQALEKYRQKYGDVDQTVAPLQTYLETFVVENQEQAIKLGEIRVSLNDRLKDIEKERKAIADPQYKAWKATGAFFKRFSQPVKSLITAVDSKLRGWEMQQRQKQLQAQQEAQEAANRAMEAQAKGDSLAAAQEFSKAQEAIAVSVQETESAIGLQKRETWHAEVTDLKAFLAAVVKLPDPSILVTPNQSTLNRLARESRTDGAELMPGVVVKKEIGFAS